MTMRPRTERRSTSRTSVNRGGLLFFKGQLGARGYSIIDISYRGVKLRTHQLSALPINFEMTFDNFTTVHRCRLVWRKGDLIGTAFANGFAEMEK